jgi:hypothetical protein
VIRTCCVWLQSMITTAGEQGLGVIAFRDGEYRRFRLQARPLAPRQASRWEDIIRSEAPSPILSRLSTDEQGRLTPLLTLLSLPIQFCPHCGTDLRLLIEQNRDDYDALARSHEELVTK